MSKNISIKNSTVLLWWFLYILVGFSTGMGGGIAGAAALEAVFGMIGGLPQFIALFTLFPFLILVNFLVYKWSVQKIIHASLHKKADTARTTNPSDPSLSQPN